MGQNVKIRFASPADAAALAEIYRPYVERTAVSFEREAPSVGEFSARMVRIQSRYPYLVAERDGAIWGYAYAAPFVGRAAYDRCAECTVYLSENRRRQGTGRALYTALEEVLRAMHIYNAEACVAVPEVPDEYLNGDSAAFHARMGFRTVGRFTRCGYKFGRWYDMIWMEKLLGEHPQTPPELRPISAVREEWELRRTGEEI